MTELQGDSSIVLGKRNQREDGDGEHSNAGSTLFVSNIPYTATSTDLQTLFSDFGPVRSAFVVLEENVSKGVGYVAFAIKEDALSAMDTIGKGGLTLEGRKLRVQWAERKHKDKSDENVNSENKTPVIPRRSFPKLAKDPDAIRMIVMSGLPSSIDQKVLWKKVRKYGGAKSVKLVDGEQGVAHALFDSPANAARAVEKLHAHVFKGAILSVTLKKRLETLSKTPAKEKSGGGILSDPAPNRASRLIVRNLPWDILEQDLRALFLPYGPIYSITIPIVQAEDGKRFRTRGFAFVWFFSKKDAERAIEGVNGRAVVAGAITAPTMNKKERARLRKKLREEQNKKCVEVEDAGEGAYVDEERLSSHPNERKESEPRVVAVDWALSKEKWEEAKSKGLISQSEGDDEDFEDGNEEDDSAGEAGHSETKQGEDPDVWADEGMSVDGRSDEEQAVKPSLPQTDVGTTLFVRNVPFDATEDELRALFRTFGPLRYARITVDHETGRSRGTGFLCFWEKEDADRAIHQSELLNREVGLEAPKKNPFSMPSLLTPDPSSSLAQSLVLHGRTLDVTRAVTRDEAEKLKDEGERAREKADKRNLYLLREGVVFPNSPAAASLSPAELEKRTTSFNTRRALLKSNPSLFVSKTRLSIRQLPTFTTERSLKRLAIHAVRTFESEVKSVSRQPLTADELCEDTDEVVDFQRSEGSGSEAGEPKTRKDKRKFKGQDSKVKQAKIVRESDHIDAVTGKGKSKGYGFLEMTRHSDALRVLRWANNNLAVGELLQQWWEVEVEEYIKRIEGDAGKDNRKRDEAEEDIEARLRRLKDELERLKSGGGRRGMKTLILEFSIENAQVVNRRKEKQELHKSRPKEAQSRNRDRSEDSDDVMDKKHSKRRKVQAATSLKRQIPPRKVGVEDDAPIREGNNLGGLIGRKRKMRKLKGKA